MHSFESDGVAIAYIDVAPGAAPDAAPGGGPGDPVLLIHGFASNHAVNWVNTLWVRALAGAGYRVIALDNRGHGRSGKLYDPAAYGSDVMAEDARRLLDHLGIARADVMGYSMGARITAFLALAHPGRVRSALLGGLGLHLVEGRGLPEGVPEAMEAPSAAAVADPTARAFRLFAEATRSDLAAMAACMRGSGVGGHARRGRGLGGRARRAPPERARARRARARPRHGGRRPGAPGGRAGVPGRARLIAHP